MLLDIPSAFLCAPALSFRHFFLLFLYTPLPFSFRWLPCSLERLLLPVCPPWLLSPLHHLSLLAARLSVSPLLLLPSHWPGSPQGSRFPRWFPSENQQSWVWPSGCWRVMESRSVDWECSSEDIWEGCECGSPFGVSSGSPTHAGVKSICALCCCVFLCILFSICTCIFYHTWLQCF